MVNLYKFARSCLVASLLPMLALTFCFHQTTLPTRSSGIILSHLHIARSQQDCVLGDSLLSQTALFAQNKKDNDNEGDNAVSEVKNIVTIIFVTLLAAEFILTPILKPIILAARDAPP
mmetsp:Transcript_18270/g.27609  ORF Transcript_18270/g.27609 Transcript_18270/m.27609 type:complete len:118 (-) Transcript_18270:52-405(-)